VLRESQVHLLHAKPTNAPIIKSFTQIFFIFCWRLLCNTNKGGEDQYWLCFAPGCNFFELDMIIQSKERMSLLVMLIAKEEALVLLLLLRLFI
jgi:hypothetical protein